jgi:hypothetical protein
LSKLYIIGDSHCLTFDRVKNVEPRWQGSATAFNLWKRNAAIMGILNEAKPDEEVWFIVGEIDCRMHIYRLHMGTGIVPMEFFINMTAFAYVSYIATLKHYRKVGIMALPPQGFQDNFFDYDYYADRETRQKITHGFNLGVHCHCHEYDIPFIDIWEQGWNNLLLDNEDPLWPKEDFMEDKCHVKHELASKNLEVYLERTNRRL